MYMLPVHVKLQRNSRKVALGDPTSDFYVDITPFWGFFSRQSESLAEEVTS